MDVTISDKPQKELYVRLKFITLCTWSYNYLTHEGINHSGNSEEELKFHFLGMAVTNIEEPHACSFTLINSTQLDQTYDVSLAFYRPIQTIINPNYYDFDDVSLFEKIEEKKYTDTIPKTGPVRQKSEAIEFE